MVSKMKQPELRMDAYYYGFGSTGVRSIDRVLSAVACAGKAFHSTDQWTEACESYHPEIVGNTCEQWIQNAADGAALETKELLGALKALVADLDVREGSLLSFEDRAPRAETLKAIVAAIAKAEGR
jgi:hypothetical protein